MTSTLPAAAAHEDRGAFVFIGASPYVAYAVHGEPAHLARYTRDPDGSTILHPVGAPFARLDLAVDAGRWRAERKAHARSAEHRCRRCGTPITLIGGAWVSMDSTTTAAGSSSCPPDPDAPHAGDHVAHRVRGDAMVPGSAVQPAAGPATRDVAVSDHSTAEPARSQRSYTVTAQVTVRADADLGDPFARVAVFRALVHQLTTAEHQVQTPYGAASAHIGLVTAV
ncbi:MAG TPA: hypothetical protein VK453_11940, partial [Micromonosporaceae bacterium]|nr:hypothetical protein [Micromonosporaceae bacterium]